MAFTIGKIKIEPKPDKKQIEKMNELIGKSVNNLWYIDEKAELKVKNPINCEKAYNQLVKIIETFEMYDYVFNGKIIVYGHNDCKTLIVENNEVFIEEVSKEQFIETINNMKDTLNGIMIFTNSFLNEMKKSKEPITDNHIKGVLEFIKKQIENIA